MLRKSLAAAAVLGALALAAVPAAVADSAVSPGGMLAVSVPSPVLTGVAETYTITVTNPFADAMSNATVGVTLPSSFTLKAFGSECARTNRPSSGTAFQCAWASIAPGASASTTVSLIASSPGTWSIPFALTGLLPIPGAPGAFSVVTDSTTLNVGVGPGPTDIQVTGSSNQGSPPVGSVFTYTFQVKNNGPQAAYGVTFDDTLPAGILLGSNLATDNGLCTASFATNSVHCDVGLLGVGQQSDISFTAQPTAAGSFTDLASVAMLGPDTHPANNSVGVTVQPK
jgi:uncharacterized repeat protein (TIGR01451 family)